MKKQTAVEWLHSELDELKMTKNKRSLVLHLNLLAELFQQAKAMEKEQIREAHFTSSGCNSFDMPTDRINSAYKAAEQYYTETYESNNRI